MSRQARLNTPRIRRNRPRTRSPQRELSMFMIEVDAEVYHAILDICTAKGLTVSAALRPRLRLPVARVQLASPLPPSHPTHWHFDDVAFTIGMELRGSGRFAGCRGVVVATGIQVNGEILHSVSRAAKVVAHGTVRNGWDFWKFQQGQRWCPINVLRPPGMRRQRTRRRPD